jgi:predicted GNAT family acetyltransferase
MSGAPTPSGIRVGPVYTPPDRRRRGYGAAVTAELTRRELAVGRRYCFLYTDEANPTSNSVYRRIGYRVVGDSTQWRLR